MKIGSYVNVFGFRRGLSYGFINSTNVLAIIVILLGVFFRFSDLDRLSLWSDELFSVVTALDVGKGKDWYEFEPKVIQELNYSDSFLTWKAADNTPPLFEGLLYFWATFFGNSDFSLRALNALLGSLAPVIFYFSMVNSVGRKPALIGTCFLALSPSAIYYSQEVRAYGLALFFATIAVSRLMNNIAKVYRFGSYESSTIRNYNIYKDIIVLLLLSYSHYTGLFLSGLIAAIYLLLISFPQRRYQDVFIFLVVPALVFPWIYLSLKAFKHSSAGGYAWRDYGLQDIYQFMAPQTADFLMPQLGGPLLVGAFVLFFLSIFSLKKWGVFRQSISKSLSDVLVVKVLLNIFLLSTIFFLFAYSVYNSFTAKMWHPRYFTVAIPVFAAIISLSLSMLLYLRKWIWCLIILFTVLILINFLPRIVEKSPKEEYREASLYISNQIKSGDVIIVGWTPSEALYRHYLGNFIDQSVSYTVIGVRTLDDVKALCSDLKPGHNYFVFQHAYQSQYFKAMTECEQVSEVDSKSYYNILVYKFNSLLQ